MREEFMDYHRRMSSKAQRCRPMTGRRMTVSTPPEATGATAAHLRRQGWEPACGDGAIRALKLYDYTVVSRSKSLRLWALWHRFHGAQAFADSIVTNPHSN